ncbi:MAG: hypothetical protein QME42_05445 [bacterium]|nr:hypothetical protein [bacterium]
MPVMVNVPEVVQTSEKFSANLDCSSPRTIIVVFPGLGLSNSSRVCTFIDSGIPTVKVPAVGGTNSNFAIGPGVTVTVTVPLLPCASAVISTVPVLLPAVNVVVAELPPYH